MKMNYFTFGTNDMEKAIGFYDSLFQETGVNKIYSEKVVKFTPPLRGCVGKIKLRSIFPFVHLS